MAFVPPTPNVPQATNWQRNYAPGAPSPGSQPSWLGPNGQPFQTPVGGGLQAQLAQQPQAQQNGSGLWSALQAQNGPQSIQYQNIGQQLVRDQGLQTQMTGLNKQNLTDQTNITLNRANKMIANAQAEYEHAKQGEGFVGQLYGQANKQAGIQYGAQREALLSDATSRGAVNAHGTIGQFTNQYQNFQNQLAGNLTQKNRSISDLRLQEEQAQNLSQQFGLDKIALVDRLHNGLAQIGLQGQINAGDILKAIYGNDANKAALAQNLVQQFIGMGQNNPGLMGGPSGFSATPQIAPGQGPQQQFQSGSGRVQ